MWWMYIGLGVVVALLVIFLFAMLAYSSTDMGESRRRLAAEAPLIPSKHTGRTERLDHVEHVRPHIRQRLFDRRHPAQDLRAHERLTAPASASCVCVLDQRLQSIDGVGESRFRRRMRLELVP